MADKRRGLGRGLSALMADLAQPEGEAPARAPNRVLPLGALRANPDQPRRRFDEERLAELAESLRAKGVIQPLIVRPDPAEEGAWQIVAGERRFRAAQIARLHEVPVIVRDYDDAEVLEIAIIENVQRAELDAIDEGAAYRTLMNRFGHTQDQVAGALGKSRSHIANQIRLLLLPEGVQAMVRDGRLAAGHARPLIGHPRAEALAARIAEKGLSAREAERLARPAVLGPPPGAPARAEAPPRDADTAALEADVAAALGMTVTLRHDGAKGSGRLTVAYKDLDELDALLARLTGGKGR